MGYRDPECKQRKTCFVPLLFKIKPFLPATRNWSVILIKKHSLDPSQKNSPGITRD